MSRPRERASAADALCRVLRDGDDAHRFYAAQALGRIGAIAAVPALIETLHDEDPDVRSAAAESLGILGDVSAVGPLLENLTGDPSSDVKLNAVIALGKLRDHRAVSLLSELARSRGEDVVWDEKEFISGGWDDWLDVQVKAIEALTAMRAADAVPDILAAMDDPDGQDLFDIGCKALAALGREGIGQLGFFVTAGSDRLRRSAARALATVASGTAHDHLRKALKDPLPEVRQIALRAIGKADPHDPALAVCLRDSSPLIRAAAIDIYDIPDSDIIGTLLDDPDDKVQAAIITQLTRPGVVQPPSLEQRLRVKLRGPSEAVAIAAVKAFAWLAPESAVADLCEQATDPRCPVGLRCAALEALGIYTEAAALDTIISALTDDERRVRITATVVLGQLATDDQRARDALLQALNPATAEPTAATPVQAANEDEPEAPAAEDDGAAPAFPTSTLAALTAADTPPATPKESLDLTEEDLSYLELAGRQKKRRKHVPVDPDVSKDDDIRRIAARVLGDVTDPSAAQALAAALTDGDSETRRNAADSFARLAARDTALAAPHLDALQKALTNEKDSQVRCLLLRALGTQTETTVTPQLQRLLQHEDSFTRAAAVTALAAQPDGAAHVEPCLADFDPAVRLATANAFARRPTPARIDKLIAQAFAFEGEQREAIGRLLHTAAPDQASAAFATVLMDDTHRRQWRIAIEALQEVAAAANPS